jgi:hypothetical protein
MTTIDPPSGNTPGYPPDNILRTKPDNLSDPSPFLQFKATKTLHTTLGPKLLDVQFQLPKGGKLAIYGPSAPA